MGDNRIDKETQDRFNSLSSKRFEGESFSEYKARLKMTNAILKFYKKHGRYPQ